MIKRMVTAAAGKLGYTIVPTWQIETFSGTRHLRRLLDLLSVDLVIDVGANVGQFRDNLRHQCGYRGRIVSFEPVPQLAASLAARAAADPLWSVENRALGAKPGTAEFNVMQDTQFSSFLTPRHDNVSLFNEWNSVRERVPVEVTTLDAVLPPFISEFSPRAIYLKIDTQGFDLEVLKGAEASLLRIAAFQAEASVRPIYDGSPSYRDIIDHAAAHGFVVSGFASNNDGHFPQLIEFDCVMIQRRYVTQ